MLSVPLEWSEGLCKEKHPKQKVWLPRRDVEETLVLGCWVMERDQQAFAGNPAKDRHHFHSCANQPSWLLEPWQGQLRPPLPQATHGVHGGRAGRHRGPQPSEPVQLGHLPIATFTMHNILQASEEKKSSPCIQAK